MNEALADVDRRIVGTKQLLRALDEGRIAQACVAADADLLLTKRVVDRCYNLNVPCTQVESMEKLGRACGIDVKAAAAGLLRSAPQGGEATGLLTAGRLFWRKARRIHRI